MTAHFHSTTTQGSPEQTIPDNKNSRKVHCRAISTTCQPVQFASENRPFCLRNPVTVVVRTVSTDSSLNTFGWMSAASLRSSVITVLAPSTSSIISLAIGLYSPMYRFSCHDQSSHFSSSPWYTGGGNNLTSTRFLSLRSPFCFTLSLSSEPKLRYHAKFNSTKQRISSNQDQSLPQ